MPATQRPTMMDHETCNMLARALASYICNPVLPTDNQSYDFERGYQAALVNLVRNHRQVPTNLVALAKLVDPGCNIIDMLPGQDARA